MTLVGSRRLVARFGARSSAGEGVQGIPIHGRRDKSTCPKRCKPLTRLAFRRACRSVAGMKPGFSEGFQGFRMHGVEKPLSGASS